MITIIYRYKKKNIFNLFDSSHLFRLVFSPYTVPTDTQAKSHYTFRRWIRFHFRNIIRQQRKREIKGIRIPHKKAEKRTKLHGSNCDANGVNG